MGLSADVQQSGVPVADQIDRFVLWIGRNVAWGYFVLMLIIIAQVVLRKGFSGGLIALEELQWHLYAVGFMFGIPYAQAKNSHVRVDLFAAHFSRPVQHCVEILGMIVLVLPLVFVVVYHSLDFVYDAWRTGESSDAPAGLPYRYLIKSVIPASFILLGLAVVSRIIRECVLLVREVKHGN